MNLLRTPLTTAWHLARSAAASPVWLFAALLAAAAAAQAAPASSVYKWVDEKGIVNYTTTPPPAQRKAAVVDVAPAMTGRSALHGYSDLSYSWTPDAAGQSELERMRSQGEQTRQAQSRAELAAQRTARSQAANQQAVDRCRSQRHVDCDINPYPAGSTLDPYSLYPYRTIVGVRRAPVVTPPAVK